LLRGQEKSLEYCKKSTQKIFLNPKILSWSRGGGSQSHTHQQQPPDDEEVRQKRLKSVEMPAVFPLDFGWFVLLVLPLGFGVARGATGVLPAHTALFAAACCG
jgi:hypothetical protein